MSYTFNDFITECSIYEYGKEYLDMLKESYELDMMARHINALTFRDECGPVLEAAGYGNAAAFFTEAVSTSYDVDYMTRLYEEKADGLFTKVKKGILFVIDKLIKFFKRIFNLMTQNEKDAENIVKELNGLTLNKAAVEKLQKALDVTFDKYLNHAEMGGKIANVQPFASKINLKFETGAAPTKADIKKMTNRLAIILSDTEVNINSDEIRIKGNTEFRPMAIAELNKIISRRNDNNTDAVASAITEVIKADIMKHQMTVKVADKKLEKLIAKLEDIKVGIDKEISDAKAVKGGDLVQAENSAKISNLNIINNEVAATLTIYNWYVTVRSNGIKELKNFLRNPSEAVSQPALQHGKDGYSDSIQDAIAHQM